MLAVPLLRFRPPVHKWPHLALPVSSARRPPGGLLPEACELPMTNPVAGLPALYVRIWPPSGRLTLPVRSPAPSPGQALPVACSLPPLQPSRSGHGCACPSHCALFSIKLDRKPSSIAPNLNFLARVSDLSLFKCSVFYLGCSQVTQV